MSLLQEIEEKADLFESRGYVYSFARNSYVNRRERKMFSAQCVEDQSFDALRGWLDEPPSADRSWKFYFNGEDPSPELRADLTAALGG